MINRNKLEHILEYAKQQRHIGQYCKVPPEDMVEIMERLLSACNPPVIPDGYVMVPKEPTDEMIAAAMNCEDVLFNSDDSFCVQFGNIYEAMLAAAPQSPGSEPATVPGKWIPVSERMPENDGAYLCWDNRYVTTYAFMFGAWQANQFVAKNITHWMPLPAAPQEVKSE
ncbi:Eaa1 [Klebsiella pneumoniae]|nr:Eaa1 [Klebsiella pneumoniae]HAH3493618.1 hypothetical protein [Escherichia coli]